VTDESSRWAFQDAIRRGVRIRLLVEGDITDAMPVKYASRKHYDQLMELGIEIYEYQPTMMHTKTFVVDGVWSMFGSANFDNRSLELNDELNVAVANPDLAARLLADFEQDVKASRRLDLQAWRQRSMLMKAREFFWASFGEIF
jgi:cardiolipin synthase